MSLHAPQWLKCFTQNNSKWRETLSDKRGNQSLKIKQQNLMILAISPECQKTVSNVTSKCLTRSKHTCKWHHKWQIVGYLFYARIFATKECKAIETLIQELLHYKLSEVIEKNVFLNLYFNNIHSEIMYSKTFDESAVLNCQ